MNRNEYNYVRISYLLELVRERDAAEARAVQAEEAAATATKLLVEYTAKIQELERRRPLEWVRGGHVLLPDDVYDIDDAYDIGGFKEAVRQAAAQLEETKT